MDSVKAKYNLTLKIYVYGFRILALSNYRRISSTSNQ